MLGACVHHGERRVRCVRDARVSVRERRVGRCCCCGSAEQKRCYVGLSFYASTESRGIEAPDTERFLRSRQLARESLSERALSTESDWH